MRCGENGLSSIWTLNIVFERKNLLMLMICIRMFRFIILDSRARCQTLFNTYSKFKKTAAVLSLLLADLASSSMRPVNWAVVEWPR